MAPTGTYAMFLPAHYLKKFHPAYTAKEEIDQPAQAASFKTWTELFADAGRAAENPERPTMAAWMPVSRVSDPVFTLRRNPYYIGVDTAGNQLPYIDEVRFTYFADVQALNLAAIAGNFDMQERHIQMTNYPVFKEQEKTGKYRVITWPTFGGVGCGDRVQHYLQGRSRNRQADGDQGIPRRAVATRSIATRSRSWYSWDWARRGRACRRRGIRISRARSGRRSTPSSTATRPTRCWTHSA